MMNSFLGSSNAMSLSAFLFFVLTLLPTPSSASNSLSAYDVLRSYDFPMGLLPEGVTGYELDPGTGKFAAYLDQACSFSIEGYKLKYSSTITGDTDKHQFTHSALKIRKFVDKIVAKKRKLLAKDLGTAVDELFSDSLDEVIAMSPTEVGNRKSIALVIPRVGKKKKPTSEWSEVTAQRIPKPTEDTVVKQPQDAEQNKEIVSVVVTNSFGQVGTSAGLVDLTNQSLV